MIYIRYLDGPKAHSVEIRQDHELPKKVSVMIPDYGEAGPHRAYCYVLDHVFKNTGFYKLVTHDEIS